MDNLWDELTAAGWMKIENPLPKGVKNIIALPTSLQLTVSNDVFMTVEYVPIWAWFDKMREVYCFGALSKDALHLFDQTAKVGFMPSEILELEAAYWIP